MQIKLRLLKLVLLGAAVILGSNYPSTSCAAKLSQPVVSTQDKSAVISSSSATNGEAAEAEQGTKISATAQRLYERVRSQLIKVRTLLRGSETQASVGSGFIVAPDGLIVTNYHVVSEVALHPERYHLTYVSANDQVGTLELLAFDVAHDLAVVRPSSGTTLAKQGLALRPLAEPLMRGQRIYSLGNPLDIGFAVIEGIYNGLVERSFYPTIFFSGALNPGMSGGPVLDDQARVLGVNVAARFDGQQVSFLVPAQPVYEVLARARKAAAPMRQPAYAELTRQLLVHQDTLTTRFMAQPWRSAGHARYRIPVPQETFLHCWGNGSTAESKGLGFETSKCRMEQPVFVNHVVYTGYITAEHSIYDGKKIGPLRFAYQYSEQFNHQPHGLFDSSWQRTASQCEEQFIDHDGLALRAVICMQAYKKLPGLYDLTVLVATLDSAMGGIQGQFSANGVSFSNALKLADFYLKGYGWTQAPKAGTSAQSH